MSIWTPIREPLTEITPSVNPDEWVEEDEE